jgi:hydrogenase expression/formation protein HypC
MKIVSRTDGTHCLVEFGGVERTVCTRLLPDCREGDYVLVHAGYAIEKVCPEQAEDDLALFRQLKAEMKR